MRTVYLNAAYFPAVELLSAVASGVILLYGGYQVIDGNVTIGVLSRLTRTLDHYARMGRIRRGLPVYLTEFGIQSRPDPYVGVSWQRQAEFRSISEWYAWRNPRVAAFSQRSGFRPPLRRTQNRVKRKTRSAYGSGSTRARRSTRARSSSAGR